jgi:hypothetical protein
MFRFLLKKNWRAFLFFSVLIVLHVCSPSDISNFTVRDQRSRPSSVSPKVYVVLAADFDSLASIENYGILAPLTSFIWNRVFNVTPIVILSTKEPGCVITATEAFFAKLVRRAGGRIHCISKGTSSGDSVGGVALNPDLVGATLITALQVSRIASIALQYINDNDVIFTSDADVWPMSTVFWHKYLSNSLNMGDEDFLVYDKRFFYEQKEKKDCNFLAVTLGFGAKTHIWRKILSTWLHSLTFAPSPRQPFCVYPSISNSYPVLPWYSGDEKKQYSDFLKSSQNRNGSGIKFPELLRMLLDEGKNVYGPVWEREIWEMGGENYKQKFIWNYDQVLVAEMLLASNNNLLVNEDLRRLDKFGTRDSELVYRDTVSGKSVDDFTDAHIDRVDKTNLWRLERIWLFIFNGKSHVRLHTEAKEYFQSVRNVYDAIGSDIGEETRRNILLQDESDLRDELRYCDKG